MKKKIEEQAKEEQENLLAKQRDQIREEKQKQLELRNSIAKELEDKESQYLKTHWDHYQGILAGFRKTTSLPVIYYRFNSDPTKANTFGANASSEEAASRRRSADAEEEEEEEAGEKEESKIEAVVVEQTGTAPEASQSND